MTKITGVNKAIIYTKPGTTHTEVKEFPISEPGQGEVLVRLSYSGVCHSDYGVCANAWSGMLALTPEGQIGGHEGIGEVVALGPGVTIPALGSLVGIKWCQYACLSCPQCLAGGETLCSTMRISGYYTPGTFQQYCVSPASYVTPIPSSIDQAAAAPLMCGGVTVYSALKKADLKIGSWVVITGAGGGLGHLAIQYARTMGARVIAIDTAQKKEFCECLGAEVFLDFTKFPKDEDLQAKVKAASNGGAQAVLACSASNRSYDQAIGMLGFRGTLVCVGVPEGKQLPIAGAVVSSLIGLELKIKGSNTGNRLDAIEALDIAARGCVKTSYEVRKMTDLTETFEQMNRHEINGRIVIDLR